MMITRLVSLKEVLLPDSGVLVTVVVGCRGGGGGDEVGKFVSEIRGGAV